MPENRSLMPLCKAVLKVGFFYIFFAGGNLHPDNMSVKLRYLMDWLFSGRLFLDFEGFYPFNISEGFLKEVKNEYT